MIRHLPIMQWPGTGAAERVEKGGGEWLRLRMNLWRDKTAGHRALRKDKPRGMLMTVLTFLPYKPFTAPSAEMKKLRELRDLCG